MRSAGLATAKIHRGIGRDLISCVSITRTLMVSCRVAVASARRIRTGLTDQSVSQRESDQSLDVHASSAPETVVSAQSRMGEIQEDVETPLLFFSERPR